MSKYLNNSHTAWLPRHCVITPKEDIPYRLEGNMHVVTHRFSQQRHLDMCASTANNAINKMIGLYSHPKAGFGFTSRKRKP